MELGIQTSAGAAPVKVNLPDSPLRNVALKLLHESPLNPRKTFNQTTLDEMSASMGKRREAGLEPLIQPIVARPSPWEKGQWEIVAGARRYRAAKIAGIETVSVIVREMTDAQVLEAMVVENGQRDDVPALEEAEGFRALMKLGKLTAAEVGERAGGKSKEHVYGRLKLLEASEPVRKVLAAGKITPGHAILLARLQPKDQERGLAACHEDWRGELPSVRALDEWIEQNVRLRLEEAPFPLADAVLVPAAGSCDKCPKRDAKSCLDPACFKGKVRAFVDSKKAALAAKGEFLLLTESWGHTETKGGVLQHYLWEEAGDKSKGVMRGLIVDGANAGKVLRVVRKEHRAPKKHDWAAESAKRQREQERERHVRRAIFDAAVEHVKAPLERVDLEFIAEGLLAEDRGDRGDVDLQALKPQALAHLLIELSIAGELNWGGGKPERLLALAKRCKVNVDKVRAAAEADWKKAQAAPAPVQTAAKAGAK